MFNLEQRITKYLAETFDISDAAAQAHASHLIEVMAFYAPPYAYCPGQCGCLLDGEDADRNECGCDGPCCDGEVAFVRDDEIVALVQTKRLAST